MAENEIKNKPIPVTENNVVSSYANFCRVTGSPEELIVDFGMNSQPMGGGQDSSRYFSADCFELFHCQAFAARVACVGSASRRSLR